MRDVDYIDKMWWDKEAQDEYDFDARPEKIEYKLDIDKKNDWIESHMKTTMNPQTRDFWENQFEANCKFSSAFKEKFYNKIEL